MQRSALALSAAALCVISACVVVPVTGTPTGTGPITNGSSVASTEDWGRSLWGRGLSRPGEFVNFFSDGTFAWDGPNGQLEFLSDGGGAPIYWNIV